SNTCIPHTQSATTHNIKPSSQRPLRNIGTNRKHHYGTAYLIPKPHCGFDCAGVCRVKHLHEALIVYISRDWIDVDRGAIGRLFDTVTNIQSVPSMKFVFTMRGNSYTSRCVNTLTHSFCV